MFTSSIPGRLDPAVPTTGKNPRPIRCAWEVVEAQSLQMGLELLLICRVGLMFHHLSTSGSNIAQKMGFSLKIPQKKIMVNQSNHHFSPEVTSLFGVYLGSPNTAPVSAGLPRRRVVPLPPVRTASNF